LCLVFSVWCVWSFGVDVNRNLVALGIEALVCSVTDKAGETGQSLRSSEPLDVLVENLIDGRRIRIRPFPDFNNIGGVGQLTCPFNSTVEPGSHYELPYRCHHAVHGVVVLARRGSDPCSSNSVPAGSVISENPTAGTLVSLGSPVNLVVSGSQPISVGPSIGSAGRHKSGSASDQFLE
jgi:hypothetical protein